MTTSLSPYGKPLTSLEEAHNSRIALSTVGMQYNGLRDSTNVLNYFPSPSRQNIIANAPKSQIPGSNDPITSIGIVQFSGLREVNSGPTGPGTFSNANIDVKNPETLSYEQIGKTLLNDKKALFVNYRQTAPFLVDALRDCPLSIYGTEKAKNGEIVPNMTYIRPEHYNNYKTETPKVQRSSIKKAIHGSPQVDVLGLDQPNPMMGLDSIPNTQPKFTGKTYGGRSGNAQPYAEALYEQGKLPGGQNKTLSHFAPGYNIAWQVNKGRINTFVAPQVENNFARDNLPWGPKSKYEGGIWPLGKGDPKPAVNTQWGYRNT